jgi:hypothetical protein
MPDRAETRPCHIIPEDPTRAKARDGVYSSLIEEEQPTETSLIGSDLPRVQTDGVVAVECVLTDPFAIAKWYRPIHARNVVRELECFLIRTIMSEAHQAALLEVQYQDRVRGDSKTDWYSEFTWAFAFGSV